jgi:hypothetical protein
VLFREDLTERLRKKLKEEGFKVGPHGQEDWGWYLRLRYGPNSYLLGIGPSGNEPPNGNDGEWCVIVKKDRSFWQMMTNKGKIRDDDPVAARIERLLREEDDFRNVRTEEDTLGRRQSDS